MYKVKGCEPCHNICSGRACPWSQENNVVPISLAFVYHLLQHGFEKPISIFELTICLGIVRHIKIMSETKEVR